MSRYVCYELVMRITGVQLYRYGLYVARKRHNGWQYAYYYPACYADSSSALHPSHLRGTRAPLTDLVSSLKACAVSLSSVSIKCSADNV